MDEKIILNEKSRYEIKLNKRLNKFKRQKERDNKYITNFSKKFDINICKFGKTIGDIVTNLPNVLNDIINEYLFHICYRCHTKSLCTIVKHVDIPTSYFGPHIPELIYEDTEFLDAHPYWITAYSICENCITVCKNCKRKLSKLPNSTDIITIPVHIDYLLLCEFCYDFENSCPVCGGINICLCD